MNKFDVIIIGAGPIGLSCGIEAKKRNKSHLIIEKGCLVNSLFHYPINMTFFSTSERLEIGEIPFVSHGDKPTRSESLEYYRRTAEAWKLNIHTYEELFNIVKIDDAFSVKTSKAEYKAKIIIAATGFYDKPNMLNIPGEDKPKVKHYFDEAHPYAYLKLLIVGAGNSAVDVALEAYRRGSEVTMVIRQDKLKDGVKYWVKPDIENRINEGSIKAYFNSELTEIRDDEVDIKTPDGTITVENDFVFAMTGYHPDYEFLKKIGIEISRDESLVPKYSENTHETNIEGLFVAGVVCGGKLTGKWFIENSMVHATSIFNHIEKMSKKFT
ncbi:MAG: YpdA family putative bacillithiol disulfide reductase [Bacteroidetes bacterium]|nr:YpdA family putative bacillithiol disulfide reductase [Bacteroidota bacterium]